MDTEYAVNTSNNTDTLLDKAQEETTNVNEKSKQEQIIPVGPIQIFRFAGWLDIFLMIFGTLGAMGCGSCFPLMNVVFGEMANSFLCHNSSLQNSSLCAEFKPIEEQIQLFSLYYAGLGFGALVCGYLQVSFWVLTASRQTRKMRKAFFHSVLSQEIGWFDVTKSGDLNTRLTEDINKINNGIGDKVGHFFQNSTTCLCGILIGLIKGWKLALVILATSPVLALASAMFARILASLTTKELAAYAKAGAVAQEVLSSIRTVVAFGGQEKEIKRYTENMREAKDIGIKKAVASQFSLGLVYGAFYSTYGLGFWYGTTLVLGDDAYRIGDVLAVFFNVTISSYCIGQAASHFEAFSIARGAAYSIFKVIQKPSFINNFSTEGFKPDNIKGNIELKNIHFSYPSRPDVKVLNGINLSIKSGQTVALVGQSGCGKSTIVQLLQRLYDPQEGTLAVDGHDIKSLNVRYYRELIGVVSQEPVLFGTTIKQNIKYGREDVTDEEIEKAVKEANAYDFIMALPDKYETLVGERGAQLSGGQKQRIAVARALVRNPKILLLDEATSALDTGSEAIVQAALDKASKGRTTIVVAHRLSTIWTADAIVVFENGAVAEQGTHSELMEKRGIYFSLATAQTVQLSEDKEITETKQNGIHEKTSLIQRFNSQASLKNIQLEEEDEEEKPDSKEKDLPSVSFLQLMKLNRSEWPYILLGIFAAGVNGAINPLFSIFYARVIAVFASNDPERIRHESTIYSILFVVISVIILIAYTVRGYMFGRSGETLTMRLRHMAFKAMIQQDIAWFDDKDNNTGALTTRLATDASEIQTATGSRLGLVAENVVGIILTVVIAFVYGWEMSLLAIAMAPFVVIAGMLEFTAVAGFATRDKKQLQRSGKIATEAVDNIRTLVSLTRERTFEEMYSESLQKPYRNAQRKAHMYGMCFATGQSFMYFIHAAVFRFGAYLIRVERMNVEEVFLVFSVITFGAMTLGNTLSFAPDYAKAMSAARYLFALFEREPTIDSFSQQGQKPEYFSGSLEFRNVSFNYPTRSDVAVLRDLCIKVESGQTVAFVGSSGCGKSTSVQLLQRFYDPQEGEMLLDDVDAKCFNVQWLRSQMGIVSQEPVLFDCSIAENIAYGDNSRTVSMDEIQSAAKAANIHSFIQGLPLKYETLVGAKGTQLSGGQKQRIAIARALIRAPKILLLDEATSALDNESEKVVQQALDQARKGRTCILIAHRLTTVQNADIIVVMNKGKIIEHGSHQELLGKHGAYYDLVNAQAII
ncbi:ATP-binding cassette sub-family B member 5-like isoform X1 [Xenopus tropicalis]|uniref:ATP-binding cassette sub-family B member 5 n=2 Tax=Xenopus tropicalis TaxID=8364 RepID=L7N303_XENTR|nr:ATP-binding cassette sub-family B member 5-like isoform X1 [Xenopus tropicalis]